MRLLVPLASRLGGPANRASASLSASRSGSPPLANTPSAPQSRLTAGQRKRELRAANGSETEVSRVATNSTRVTNATELAKQGWRPNAVEASGSGLRPEDRLVSVERSQGRVAGPSAKVSQARQVGRTLTSHGRRGEKIVRLQWQVDFKFQAILWYNISFNEGVDRNG